MRIADKMNYDQVTSNLAKNRSEMAELQNQAATQKRLTRPSDDPLAQTRVLAARTEIAGSQQFIKNINMARSFLEYSDQSLGEMADALVRAKELAIAQANDASANEASREVVATEVEQLYNQSIQIGNRKLGDRYLFGGFRTTQPPFDPNGQYLGDQGEIKITINKDAKVAMNIPGSQVFLGQGLMAPANSDDQNAGVARGPASPMLRPPTGPEGTQSTPSTNAPQPTNLSSTWRSGGVNVFEVLKTLELGLRANDKASIQASLDEIDAALAQVILARSKVGSRVMSLNATTESLQKGQIDSKSLASSLEDADTFELVSNLNKSESTLKASLATSGKLIQPSLLDFLR